jgi:phosphonate transport system substrate-binding protein
VAAVSTSAAAGWEEDFGTLRIGMVSPTGSREVPGLSEMTTAFRRATGLPVEILVARDYPALIRAQSQGRIHYAVHSAVAFAATDMLCGCVEPVATPLGVDGARGLYAVLIVRKGEIGKLADMSGARVVAGPAEDIGPQRLALAVIRQLPGRAGSIVHASSYAEAERIFREGAAAVLIGWQPAVEGDAADLQSGSIARLAAAGSPAEELDVVWSSELLAHGPHAVRRDLPRELKDRLGRFLVNLREQQPGIYAFLEPRGGGGFVRPGPGDYDAARGIAERFAAPTAGDQP